MAGFLTGWMYWYFWVIVVALEAVAGAKLIQFWLPDTPAWIISLALLVVLTLTNLISVGSYGEFEFWFSSIKVGAIMVFLFLGGLYVLGLARVDAHDVGAADAARPRRLHAARHRAGDERGGRGDRLLLRC